jgi:hypothetical protein
VSTREAIHSEPVWRERSNFIIAVEVDPADTDVTTEQLWARKVDDRHFELCCIPFLAYDLALGDVVETDAGYTVQRVSTPSGRYVFRVSFERGNHGNRDSTVEALQALGAQVEWSSPSLLAVDARDQVHAQQIADHLNEQETAQRLMYETGKTA